MTSLYISKSPQEYGWQMLSIVGGGGSHLLVWRCPCKHPLSCYLSLSCLTRVEQVRCIAQTWQSTMEHRGVHCLLSLSPRVPSSHADSESPVMSGKAKGCLWHKQWSTPPPPPPSSHPLSLSLSLWFLYSHLSACLGCCLLCYYIADVLVCISWLQKMVKFNNHVYLLLGGST